LKQISLGEMLTPEQLEAALTLWNELKGTGRFAAEAARIIIEPNLPAINQKLGQENDARYLAYALEYAFSQCEQQQAHDMTWAPDVCQFCGAQIGYGIRALHLGVCDRCREESPQQVH
jgi:hypothetical protein